MVKKIILVIVLFVTVGVIGGISFLNYKFDNSVENENVLDIGKLQNKIGNTLKQEVNEIKDNLNNLTEKNTTTVNKDTVTEKEEKQLNDKNVNTTKTNVSKNDTKENKNKNVLSNSMAMFIVLNTASIQIIPTTVIAIRSSLKSGNATGMIVPVWIATICAAIAAIGSAKILMKKF